MKSTSEWLVSEDFGDLRTGLCHLCSSFGGKNGEGGGTEVDFVMYGG